MPHPELQVVIQYPVGDNAYGLEDFFNERNELSGIIVLPKKPTVCIKTDTELKETWVDVSLGQLMMDGAKNEYSLSPFFFAGASGNDFINLNAYLIANGLVATDHNSYLVTLPYVDPTPNGVKRILTVGAAQ